MKELRDFIRRRVMIIDDNELLLETIRLFLEEAEYRVACFVDPVSALQSLEQTDPTVVVTDIRMPHMSGLQVLASVREKNTGLPVILMTGHADLTAAVDAIKSGAFDFIMKPFDLDYLRVSLDRAVRLRAAEEWEKHYIQSLEETVAERTASLRETIAELEIAKQKAEEASKLKSEFLTNITHELRTPASGIVGMIDIAIEEADPAERAAYLEMARDSALRLLNLFQGIISFTAISTEPPEEAVFDPRAVAAPVVDDCRQMAHDKSLELDAVVAANVPDQIVGDRKRFSLLLRHLMENALKFTAAGYVRLSCIVDKNDTLVVEVRDTGTGIPAEFRHLVLEPFRQVDGSLSRQFEGAGMGLAIVSRIVEAQGGEIAIEENPQGGTVVTCRLPFGPGAVR